MKLRNKKTGEIIELLAKPSFVKRDKGNFLLSEVNCFNSLAELNEEWEDVPEEPAGYWYIDFDSDILGCVEPFDEETDEKRKSIGNYFESEEEAKKAVEKLKAVKRLKDNGFRFTGYKDNTNPKGNSYQIIIKAIFDGASFDDLDLLFGSEE